ncbi:MAG: hypothetical protein CL521_00370 [Actinobacteria bacterium]|nr:hypothetical protein [Actinomycetota bacterium]
MIKPNRYNWPLWLLLLSIRTLCRFFRDLDGLMTAATQLPIKPAYIRTGACKKRGVCCTQIAVGFKDRFWHWPYFRTLIKHWYCFVYNFKCLGEIHEEKALLFACQYLKNKQCQIHWKRPYICRNYPRQYFFKRSNVLPGCGFKFIKRSDPT